MKTYRLKKDGIVYIVVPIANEKDVRGTLVVKAEDIVFSPTNFWKGMYRFFSLSTLIFLFGAAIVGITFGIFTSRNLVKRIRNILSSTDEWGLGDFTKLVDDPSKDELGQLARRLNQMALKLRRLFQVQQDFATLEERNRLARELHDSVKQQLFATSIWLNTSRFLIETNVQLSKEHLLKAEKLLHQTRAELSALILELRPVVLEGKDLSHALADYIAMWQEQTAIDAKLKLTGEKQIPPIFEEAYFRIIQEALNNVARHSEASQVNIHLDCDEEVTLIIEDNGLGFDINTEKQRGVGLSSMSERIHTLKGEIDIKSSPGNGVKITVRCNQAEVAVNAGGVNGTNDNKANYDFSR
ncbi:HAMP domain-containing sensor histidine kinase [Oceanobacillus neutriphilus]|nr:histidine kinase [Oceanobacillus neutriphilus]